MKLASPPSHPREGLSAERATLRCGRRARGAERTALRAVTLAYGGVPVLRLVRRRVPHNARHTGGSDLRQSVSCNPSNLPSADGDHPPAPQGERSVPDKAKKCPYRTDYLGIDTLCNPAVRHHLIALYSFEQGVGLMTFVTLSVYTASTIIPHLSEAVKGFWQKSCCLLTTVHSARLSYRVEHARAATSSNYRPPFRASHRGGLQNIYFVRSRFASAAASLARLLSSHTFAARCVFRAHHKTKHFV